MKPLARASQAIVRKLLANRSMYDLAEREVNERKFKEWCVRHPAARTLRGPYEARDEMYAALMKDASLEGAIDYLEFGVFAGRSLKWWLSANKDPASSFVGFDSFLGLPEDWRAGRQAGTFARGGKPPQIDDSRCRFEIGWFTDTLPPFVRAFGHPRRTVIHLDADLYSSTLFVLTTLAPVLRNGDILVFDELHDSCHEGRALLDFESGFGFEFEVLVGMNGHGRAALRITKALTSATTPG